MEVQIMVSLSDHIVYCHISLGTHLQLVFKLKANSILIDLDEYHYEHF